MTEDEMVGWLDHQLDGQGGLACCSPWSRNRATPAPAPAPREREEFSLEKARKGLQQSFLTPVMQLNHQQSLETHQHSSHRLESPV